MQTVKSLFLILSIFIGLMLNLRALAGETPKAASESPLANEIWKGPFFWQTKAEVKHKIFNDRLIVVSAKKEQGVNWMKGAGVVQAPAPHIFKFAQDFKRLETLPDHFDEVKFDRENSLLEFKLKILGQARKLVFKIDLIDEASKRIDWTVIEGPFLGSFGSLVIQEAGWQKSLVFIVGRFEGSTGWMPQFIFEMGVEGVLSHVAISLRTLVEKDFLKDGK